MVRTHLKGFLRRTRMKARSQVEHHVILRCFAAYFIRPFYKMMLGRHIVLDDMESVVSLLYANRCWSTTLCLSPPTHLAHVIQLVVTSFSVSFTASSLRNTNIVSVS